MIVLAAEEQPPTSVTVKLYSPAVNDEIDDVVCVLLHAYVYGPPITLAVIIPFAPP